MKIYVASSWRNEHYPEVVQAIRSAGHQVYDFRNPKEHVQERDQGFHWKDIDSDWKSWSPDQFIEALTHPLAKAGYKSDQDALDAADATVLVMPCGRSAHLELGYAAGQGKPTIILLSDGEPELMYKMAHCLVTSVEDMLTALDGLASDPDPGRLKR